MNLQLTEEEQEAYDIFYDKWADRLDELDPEWLKQSYPVYDMWLYVDHRLSKDTYVVDLFLEQNPPLSPGERLYLELLRNTALRLYEIVDLSPGESVTLRDVIDNHRTTVHEQQGSRSMHKYALIAARIIAFGPSGKPEMEMGVFHIPGLIREPVVAQLTSHHKAYRGKHPQASGSEFFKEMAPFLHEAWISSILNPTLPRMANTDGEDIVETFVRFAVDDSICLETALDGAKAIERTREDESSWFWIGKNQKKKLEGSYQKALQNSQPAYDPSWMWEELGFKDRFRADYPPPMAHERVAAMVSGLGPLCRGVAEQVRRQPGFDDASTLTTIEDIRMNLEIQRFLRDIGAQNPPPTSIENLTAHMAYTINFELHRRKTFWVDDSLAYMLAKTNLEIPGSDLRAPFASFALVFTDRFVLSLGERMLSVAPECPLAGHFLRVVTVYVTTQRQAPDRSLQLCFAFDALGADPPHLVTHQMMLQADSLIRPLPEDQSPIEIEGHNAVPYADPFGQLLHVTLSAILYATSASVAPQPRSRPSGGQYPNAELTPDQPLFSDEKVFFLPGSIEISRLRQFQELERISSGRMLLHRFMVRGHWRRAAPGWRDQRVRWIAPHWKGPDIGTIIERTYKLKP
ncbi:hypothetical protein [Desulfosarcina variabilis]|uniref:hypothetical protein n=1 Tax=Desulfosarcina variabilis TaxID=2300 RepID=UPI003AFA7E8F